MMRETITRRSKRIATLAASVGCALVLFTCATARTAQTKTTKHEAPDWEDKIIPGSQLTVLDLARRIIPDIKSDPVKPDKITGADFSAIRLVDGVEETGMELDPESNDEAEVTSPDDFWMNDAGERLLVLLLKVDSEKAVIGLFKVAPEVSLLDAVTIAQDIHSDVDVERLWTIRPRHQAFSVQCWHDNSSESFDSYTFISIVDHKLRAVAGPVTSTGFSTYSAARQRLCKTATTPTFKFVRSAGREYFDLVVDQTILKVCHADSEEWNWKTGVVYRKSARSLWRWSAGKRQYLRASAGRR